MKVTKELFDLVLCSPLNYQRQGITMQQIIKCDYKRVCNPFFFLSCDLLP